MKKRTITTLAALTICAGATVLLLGCIQPKEGIRLRYDLDKVTLLRYNFTSRAPSGTTLPVSNWEVLLEVEKVGKNTYTITRTTTNYFGGLNGTFELSQEGNLSKVLLDEFSAGYGQITGEWVTVTVQGNVSGRGYYQEIPPLPGGTVLLGDYWNGTFVYNTTSQTKGLPLDTAMISTGRGYVVCEAIRREEMGTPAGEFSAVEVRSFGETTNEGYILYANGTVKPFTSGLTIPHEGTYMIDTATGIVVYSVRAIVEEEPPNQRYDVVAELVEIRKS